MKGANLSSPNLKEKDPHLFPYTTIIAHYFIFVNSQGIFPFFFAFFILNLKAIWLSFLVPPSV